MSTFSIFLVLITIVCFLLIVVIMVQNPKGGGLSSTISGTQMLGGVQKTTDFLDKSTWTLATVLIVLILLSSLSFSGALSDTDSKLIDKTEAPVNTPVAPAQGNTPAPAVPAAK
ncbi:preprotein translocase subunit SecG [Flavobacterium quisquiliarum]|jgi:preprotein translocase subunit SecG|uniref:Protein-export membrane protein SecG n=1 Tax=Flavobacterium quisquiliarum TaxID=1834436 RepID=A0ABV8W7V6_9FLAO|nr:preprotein translocase subunit SecG [Flavobacterium quisquiliarum]MBW1656942.1 preprotein translocase subunit SecG [Flavobacterium quisquiliarum]NWK99607.1 preprotein translocase subunit SecG [Flavobacterium collinsii]